jgi:hypothetical protein
LRAPVWQRFGQAAVLPQAKLLAGMSLLCWAGALIAGRMLAYTYKWLLVGIPGGF